MSFSILSMFFVTSNSRINTYFSIYQVLYGFFTSVEVGHLISLFVKFSIQVLTLAGFLKDYSRTLTVAY